MALAAWVNNPAQLPVIRPAPFVVSIIGDSKYVTGPNTAPQEIMNHASMLYGSSAPTWINHAIAGTTIESVISNGQVAAAIADNPELIIIGLGVNNISGAVRATIAADAGTVLSTLRASLPNAMIAWVNVMFGHSEQWGPDPNQAAIDAVNGGISDACALWRTQVIDVHSTQQAYEMLLNAPAVGQASGILSLDGTHGNWRGRPLEGRTVANQFYWNRPLFTNVDTDPTYTPNTDVTAFVGIEADQLSTATVSAWGPYSASGAARPVWSSNGWFNGMPAVQFDGVSNVMTASGLAVPSGAKTVMAGFYLQSAPQGFGQYVSMATFNTGTLTTELIPSFAGGTDPQLIFCADQTHTGGDGFFETGTSDISDSSGYFFPLRFGATFAGGSSTTTANYRMYWGGGTCSVTRGSTWLAQNNTAANALGARMDDGVTATNFAQFALAYLYAWPGVLTTSQFFRADQYFRRKWGP